MKSQTLEEFFLAAPAESNRKTDTKPEKEIEKPQETSEEKDDEKKDQKLNEENSQENGKESKEVEEEVENSEKSKEIKQNTEIKNAIDQLEELYGGVGNVPSFLKFLMRPGSSMDTEIRILFLFVIASLIATGCIIAFREQEYYIGFGLIGGSILLYLAFEYLVMRLGGIFAQFKQ